MTQDDYPNSPLAKERAGIVARINAFRDELLDAHDLETLGGVEVQQALTALSANLRVNMRDGKPVQKK